MAKTLQETSWPSSGKKPEPSRFEVLWGDFKIVAKDKQDGRKEVIEVCTHSCGRRLNFVLDEQDPINSRYVCMGMYCRHEWKLHEIRDMTTTQRRDLFYTKLLEDYDDEWPIKLCEKTDGKRLFSSTRPATKEEIIQSRVRRLIEERER